MAELSLKTFVLHVKNGYDNRRVHMEQMLKTQDINFEFILDGDMSDLNAERLNQYFSGDSMRQISPAVSCAFKHILVWEQMKKDQISYALVLEDDIYLSRNFKTVFNQAVEQAKLVKDPFYVSLEATCMKLVPRSQRKRNQVIYSANNTQCTGAYFCNLAYAEKMLDIIERERCNTSIDHYIGQNGAKGEFRIFWTYPVLATQGSHNGKMTSAIDGRKKQSFFIFLKRNLTMFYKRFLYLFR